MLASRTDERSNGLTLYRLLCYRDPRIAPILGREADNWLAVDSPLDQAHNRGVGQSRRDFKMEVVALAIGAMGFIFGMAAMSQVNQLRKEFERFRDSVRDPPSPST